MPEKSSGRPEGVAIREHGTDDASTSSVSIFRYPRQLLPSFYHVKKMNKSEMISDNSTPTIFKIDKLPLYLIQTFNIILLLIFLVIFLSQNSRITYLESRIDELERVSVFWVSFTISFSRIALLKCSPPTAASFNLRPLECRELN